MRIALIDLDTSHPRNWIPILREMGHRIVGVYDGGSVHPREYVEEFAREHGIDRVFDDVGELADAAELAIIHGCDWDTHLAKAQPLIQRGKPVLIDKPLAGCVRDLRQLVKWADAGARVSGGSSLRFCDEVQAFLAKPVEERGTPQTVFVSCGVDEFNYGIHAYSMLCGLMGPGVVSVQHLGTGPQRRVRVDWPDGRMGLISVGAGKKWLPFAASIVTERSICQITAEPGKLYRALLTAVLPYLTGQEPQAPVPMRDLIEPELCAIAARQSWLDGDRVVRLDAMDESDAGYDGAAFAEGYRLQRYPAAAAVGAASR